MSFIESIKENLSFIDFFVNGAEVSDSELSELSSNSSNDVATLNALRSSQKDIEGKIASYASGTGFFNNAKETTNNFKDSTSRKGRTPRKISSKIAEPKNKTSVKNVPVEERINREER